jgi:diacylglycerol kinase family enzyme
MVSASLALRLRRAVFVVNPAGIRRLHVLERHCAEAARAHGWETELLVAEEGERNAGLHHDLASYIEGEGERLVFAVGGDGTVRACARDLACSGVPLSIVPRGTANLFAKALGLPVDLDRALHTGFTGRERSVDIALAEGHPFVAMAGIGLDAAVVEATPQLFKRHLGWFGYALTGAAHVLAPARGVTLQLDGGEELVREARAVVVGNVGTLPGGFTLLGGARLDDGLLDVGVLKPRGLSGWASVARLAVAGVEAQAHFEHFQAAKVEVRADEPLPRELDGDLLPKGRSLSAEVLHKALVVRTPRNSAWP